jgi:predicted secreted protein
MAIINGTDFMLFVGSGATLQPLAYSTSVKVTNSLETKKRSSKDSTGNYDEKYPGKFDWTATSDGLLSFNATGNTQNFKDLYQLFQARSLVNVSFNTKAGSTPSWTGNTSLTYFTGQAYINSLDFSANDAEDGTYSISLDGSGQLTIH